MRKVKAKTTRLLEAIRANYEKHKADFAEAYAGYKVAAVEALTEGRLRVKKEVEAQIEKVKALDYAAGDKLFCPAVAGISCHRPPQSHAADYEVVIRMLEFETAEEVEVEQDQFESYVMDRWSWKDEFVATNAVYASKLKK